MILEEDHARDGAEFQRVITTAADDPVRGGEAAARYLGSFDRTEDSPGPALSGNAARTLVADGERVRLERENVAWWGELRPTAELVLKRVEGVQHPREEDLIALKSLRSERMKEPHAGQGPDDLVKELAALRRQADVAIANGDDAVLAGSVREDYREFLRDGDLVRAGTLLNANRSLPIAELIAEFPTEARDRLTKEHRKLLDETYFPDATELAENFEAAERDWDAELRIEGGEALFAQLKKSHDRELDQHLYEKFREYKSPGDAREYLKRTPLHAMDATVEAWLAHSERMKKPLDLKLRVDSVDFDRRWLNWSMPGWNDTTLLMTLSGVGKPIPIKVGPDPPDPAKPWTVGREYDFRARATDRSRLHRQDLGGRLALGR